MPAKTNEQLYEEAERALISEAIGETEQEIFDSAFDNAPDDNDGDTSLEEMDSDDVIDDDLDDSESEEVEDDAEEAEEEPEQDAEEQDTREADNEADRAPSRGVPSSRLREEANARRAAEAEARELRARIDALERTQRQPYQQPQPQQAPPQGPDMFADPEGWAAHERGRIMQEINNQRFNASLAEAAEQHGDRFQEAFRAVSGLPNTPENVAIAHRIYNAPNPGRELMRWHDQQNLIKDIGNDPIAFRQKMREDLMADPEFRQQVIASMRGEATSQRRTQTQLPPSLNGASGGSGHRGRDNSGRGTAHTTRALEREIFDSAWDD